VKNYALVVDLESLGAALQLRHRALAFEEVRRIGP
jgi:hypothetical protein